MALSFTNSLTDCCWDWPRTGWDLLTTPDDLALVARKRDCADDLSIARPSDVALASTKWNLVVAVVVDQS